MLAHPQLKGLLLTHLVSALDSDDPTDFDIAAANIAARFADCQTPMIGLAFGVPLQLANAAVLLRNTWGISLERIRVANKTQPHLQIVAVLLPEVPHSLPHFHDKDVVPNAPISEKRMLVNA